MARKIIDCRDFPGPCTLMIGGEADEVVEAQTAHLVAAHDMTDTPAVRAYVRSALKDVVAGPAAAPASVRQ